MQSIPQQFPAKKGGQKISYDRNKKILGTKIHIIVTSIGLPISIVISAANNHDSTKFIETMEHILDFMTRDSLKQIRHCFADKGYISRIIREYMENRNIQVHIPVRKNSIAQQSKKRKMKIKSVRFVVEQFFGMVKGEISWNCNSLCKEQRQLLGICLFSNNYDVLRGFGISSDIKNKIHL